MLSMSSAAMQAVADSIRQQGWPGLTSMPSIPAPAGQGWAGQAGGQAGRLQQDIPPRMQAVISQLGLKMPSARLPHPPATSSHASSREEVNSTLAVLVQILQLLSVIVPPTNLAAKLAHFRSTWRKGCRSCLSSVTDKAHVSTCMDGAAGPRAAIVAVCMLPSRLVRQACSGHLLLLESPILVACVRCSKEAGQSTPCSSSFARPCKCCLQYSVCYGTAMLSYEF